jgi:hypothetical protein
MTYYWITGDQLAGSSETAIPEANWPQGETLVEGPDHDYSELYWTGDTVAIRPQRPDGNYVWNLTEWVEVIIPAPEPTPNWIGLESALRNSAAWAHAYDQAEETVKANAAFTLLLTSLTSTHNENDLRFAWLRLRELMQTQQTLTDFSAEQLLFVTEALSDNGFDPEDFGLG